MPSIFKRLKAALKGKSKKPKIILGLVIFLVLAVIPLIFFLLIPGHSVSDGFKTLKEIETYAAAFDEKSIEMENTNLVKPKYTKFYKSQTKGFFGSKLATLGMGQALPWSSETYKNLLEQAVEHGKGKNYDGNFVHKIVPAPTSKVVIWGDVQGAFHSLARDLRELVKQGIIDEDLKVTSPDNYLIFMGDVTSRSPFIMETVSTVARLVLNNPENAFYVRGNHESNNYWQGYGLKRELKLRARHLGEGKVPLEQLTNDFFNTLPVAMYCGIVPNETRQFVRISHEGSGGEGKVAEINDMKLAPFLSGKLVGRLATFNYKDIKEGATSEPIEVKAVVKAEIKRKTYQAMDGLRLTSPENGITAWTMLSCPTEIYRKGLKFFFDAFSVIQAGAKVSDWTITLHHQDVRTLDGFKTRTHNLISGQEIAAGAAPTPAPAAAPAPPTPVPATPAAPVAATPPAQPTTPPVATPVTPTPAAPVVQTVPAVDPQPAQPVTPPAPTPPAAAPVQTPPTTPAPVTPPAQPAPSPTPPVAAPTTPTPTTPVPTPAPPVATPKPVTTTPAPATSQTAKPAAPTVPAQPKPATPPAPAAPPTPVPATPAAQPVPAPAPQPAKPVVTPTPTPPTPAAPAVPQPPAQPVAPAPASAAPATPAAPTAPGAITFKPMGT